MISHETRLRVRYAETDQMGVVYHSHYLVWMEVGRVELCRALGFEYRRMEADDGVLLAVVEANCRYLAPARYDDEVIVNARVDAANARMVRFGYAIRTAHDDRAVAEGFTKHIFLNREMRRQRLPEKYWPAFGLAPPER